MKVYALIADDEPNQLELIAYNLNSAGFEVTRASNGEEALRRLRFIASQGNWFAAVLYLALPLHGLSLYKLQLFFPLAFISS